MTFKLTNISKRVSAEFKAYFSPESDSEFTISPEEGILAKHGSDGTAFVISFTPVEYGKEKLAKLIIETKQMYWSFSVKGTFPKYKKPRAKHSSIDSKLKPGTLS
jgi:hypothetical protein